jgi:hypothetical protein
VVPPTYPQEWQFTLVRHHGARRSAAQVSPLGGLGRLLGVVKYAAKSNPSSSFFFQCRGW